MLGTDPLLLESQSHGEVKLLLCSTEKKKKRSGRGSQHDFCSLVCPDQSNIRTVDQDGVGTQSTVQTDPGAERSGGAPTPHCPFLLSDPGNTWHTPTFIINPLHYPSLLFTVMLWSRYCNGDSGAGRCCSKQHEGEREAAQCGPPRSFFHSCLCYRKTQSDGVKWSVAGEWICAEIAKGHWPPSISGQHAKRSETRGHF